MLLLTPLTSLRLTLTIFAAAFVASACSDGTSPNDADDPNQPKKITLLQIVAGGNHTCGITIEGAAYCWGRNASGELGTDDADTASVPSPQPVAGGLTFAQLALGIIHTCGLTSAGDVYCWGANDDGQLGDGTETDRRSPVRVGAGFVNISAFGRTTCGVTGAGEAFCWGNNSWGKLGNGFEPPQPRLSSATPMRVDSPINFSAVDVGGYHVCATTSDLSLYCWGWSIMAGTDQVPVNSATLAVKAEIERVGSFSAGAWQSCAVTTDSKVSCWGNNTDGNLGIGHFDGSSQTPVAIQHDGRFSAVSSGGSDFDVHTCAIATSGEVFCWGRNSKGQLGNGEFWGGVESTPILINGLRFSSISAGKGHTCGLATDQIAYCWGDNRNGEIGDSTTVNKNLPTRVSMQ